MSLCWQHNTLWSMQCWVGGLSMFVLGVESSPQKGHQHNTAFRWFSWFLLHHTVSFIICVPLRSLLWDVRHTWGRRWSSSIGRRDHESCESPQRAATPPGAGGCYTSTFGARGADTGWIWLVLCQRDVIALVSWVVSIWIAVTIQLLHLLGWLLQEKMGQQ